MQFNVEIYTEYIKLNSNEHKSTIFLNILSGQEHKGLRIDNWGLILMRPYRL